METRRSKRGSNKQSSTDKPFSFVVHSDTEGGAGDTHNPHCVLLKVENPKDGSPPLKSVWNNEVIPPALVPATDGLEISSVSEAFVLSRTEALLFSGKRTKNKGWTLEDARCLANQLTSGNMDWIGGPVDARGRALTLEAGAQRIKEFVAERRREKLKGKKSPHGDAPFRKTRRHRRDTSGLDSDSSEASFHSVDEGDTTQTLGTEQSDSNESDTNASVRSFIPRNRAARRRAEHKNKAPNKITLPYFSGEETSDPLTASFKNWRYDVEMYRINGVSERQLLPRVIASLRGAPGEMVRSLGTGCSLRRILQTLDGYYGDVLTSDGLIAELYTISQNEGESVAKFGMRVEKVVAMIANLFPREIDPRNSEEKIKHRFFAGLDRDIKRSISYMKKQPGVTYKALLAEAREVEEDNQRNRKQYGYKKYSDTKKDARTWPPFSSRKPSGFAAKSLRADLAEIQNAMMGQDRSDSGDESPDELDRVKQEVQALKGALNLGEAKAKNPWDKFKKNETKAGSKDPTQYKCLNCLGFGHFARECPSPRFSKDQKNEMGEADPTNPLQPQSGSANLKSARSNQDYSALDLKHGFWEAPQDDQENESDQ